VINFLASFRQVAESRMRLRIGEVEGLGRRRDRADEALAHLQLREMDGLFFQAFGGVKFKDAIGAQHIDRANLGNHVAGNLADNPVKALLRLQRLRHQLA